jgi:hypothetical protein
MKISPSTLTILKNFNSLNPAFGVKPGNIIRSISAATFAKAEVAETFEKEFAVKDLSRFIGAVSLFEEPEFEFFDNYVKISEGKNFIRYVYDEPSLLDLPPNKDIKMPTPEVEFNLSEKDYALLHKATSNLQSPYITITGEDGVIYMKAVNIDDPTASDFSMAVGVTDKEFNTAFNASNFKFLVRDYSLSLVVDRIVEFKSDNVTYWLAAHK